jgi:hypothetical protein
MDIGQSDNRSASDLLPIRAGQAPPRAVQEFEKLCLAEPLRASLRARQQLGQLAWSNPAFQPSADPDADFFGIDAQQQWETIDPTVVLKEAQSLFGGSFFKISDEAPFRHITRCVEDPGVRQPSDRGVCLVGPLRDGPEPPGNVVDPTDPDRGPGSPDRRHDCLTKLLDLVELDVQGE